MKIKIIFRVILSFVFFMGSASYSNLLVIPTKKIVDDFRDYTNTTDRVREFYRLNHLYQTFDFVQAKKNEYCSLNKKKMGIWQAMELLDTIVDESDPDLESAQSVHAFQTAQALRADGHPRWLILTGFIHDLGKMLITFGEPQWAVVGDTFPVGCAYSDKVVFPEFFSYNADYANSLYQTLYGIYSPRCGFENLIMSWGHDEYLYHVVKNYLPKEALYIIRFHSFYAAHRDGAYDHLMNDYDHAMMPWLTLFSSYDLYSKGAEKLDIDALIPFYKKLVAEFFPDELSW